VLSIFYIVITFLPRHTESWILAVTHEASATGSVRAFIAAVERFRLAGQVTVVAKDGGALLQDLGEGTWLRPWTGVAQLRRAARVQSLAGTAPLVERWIADRVVSQVRPDVVYVNTVLSSEYVSAAHRQGVRAVLHVHEQEPLLSWALHRNRVDITRTETVVPARIVANELAALGCPKITVLPGPVDLSSKPRQLKDPPWPTGSHRVLTVASMTSEKGTDDILEVADRLRRVGERPVHYVWVGPGERLATMREVTRRKGLNVTWVGAVRNPLDYMAAADLFVLPTHREVQGLVLLDAASMGTPCVAYASGGIPDLLNSQEALAPTGDIDALVDRVRESLQSADCRQRLAAAAAMLLPEREQRHWQQCLWAGMAAL
jgi:glycosyltransferase involved in cell wall biosynthesis